MAMNKRFPQSNTADITTDGTGNGSVSVTLANPYPGTSYVVVVTSQEADTSGKLYVTSKTASGFTITVSGSSVVSGVLTVGWIANYIKW